MRRGGSWAFHGSGFPISCMQTALSGFVYRSGANVVCGPGVTSFILTPTEKIGIVMKPQIEGKV